MKKLLPRSIITFLILLFILIGCSSQNKGPQKIGPRGIFHRGIETDVKEPTVLSEEEGKKKEVAERFDMQKLLYSAKVVEDTDNKMLIAPESVKQFVDKEFTIAKTPPKIEFGIVPVKPKFFAEPSEGNRVGPWSNWSQANYYKPTGKFYSSVGDHSAYDAHLYIVEYDPTAKTIKVSPEINRVLGRSMTEFQEGKIHGWLDFYPEKTPNLWFCTYWCKYPEPEEKDYATGYQGGHIMSINVETGDIVDYGAPMMRASWPYHRVDTKRGMLYAVGMFGEFLAWDIKEQKTHWAGHLPENMSWWVRAILIDEETGMVYTTNYHKSDDKKHVIKYDPFKNRFFELDCHMPKNKILTKRGITGGYNHMRAQTAHRGPDGLFWGVTYSGELFSFNPDKELIVEKGINWPGEQRYTTSMVRSSKGRYIYYLPGAHGKSFLDGSPVIQLDTRTGKKKVLAFLYPYYYEKYGYTTGGTFSIKLDDKGERLFILMNGAFIDVEEQVRKDHIDVFGHASVILVHIPESERIE